MNGTAKIDTSCAKCGVGKMGVLHYVRPVEEGFAREICYHCPPQEHLHISCDRCGYTVLGAVVEPPPPPVEPPIELAAAAAGRSKNPRGG